MGSLIEMVVKYDNVVLSVFVYWMEKIRVLLRGVTLITRFVLNMFFGYLIFIGWGMVRAYLYFDFYDWSFIWAIAMVFCVAVGVVLVGLEIGMVCIQCYLFCILLRLYRDDHCL